MLVKQYIYRHTARIIELLVYASGPASLFPAFHCVIHVALITWEWVMEETGFVLGGDSVSIIKEVVIKHWIPDYKI